MKNEIELYWETYNEFTRTFRETLIPILLNIQKEAIKRMVDIDEPGKETPIAFMTMQNYPSDRFGTLNKFEFFSWFNHGYHVLGNPKTSSHPSILCRDRNINLELECLPIFNLRTFIFLLDKKTGIEKLKTLNFLEKQLSPVAYQQC